MNVGRRKEQESSEGKSAQARLARLIGGTALVVSMVLLFLSLVSWSPTDPPAQDYVAGSRVSNLCGVVGAWSAGLLRHYFGRVTCYMLVFLGGVWTYLFFSRRELGHTPLKLVGIGLFLLSSSTFCAWYYIWTGYGDSNQLPGGVIGQDIAGLVVQYFAHWGTFVLISALCVLSLLLATDMVVWNMTLGMISGLRRAFIWVRDRRSPPVMEPALAPAGPSSLRRTRREPGSAEEIIEDVPMEPRRAAVGQMGLPLVKSEEEDEDDEDEETLKGTTATEVAEGDEEGEKAGSEEEVEREKGHLLSAAVLSETVCEIEATEFDGEEGAKPAIPSEYMLPSLELLEQAEEVDPGKYEAIVREKAIVLEKCLGEFGIRVRVVAIETGPVITMYELELAPGIKVGRLLGLTDDIAMALKAPSVRIIAPIPGKSTVGVEVPNLYKENVRLRDVMEEAASAQHKYAIPIYMGKDAGGAPLVFDLSTLPHLLIAGETGSGKSVCISTLILSVLMTRRPDEVRLLLVDPKMVEFQAFRTVPHLVSPVVTDMKKAAGIMQWAEKKMDERYEFLAAVRVRNIRSYNALGEAEIRKRLGILPDEPASSIEIPMKLPYIVIVIDELADLMMLAAKEVETSIIRLAQKSRAVGLHIVLATQRPSVDVITGLIKSNMPARITFRLLSKVDSRTILDQNGAEKLLGGGDMLFVQPGTSKLIRAQGTYVTDDEVQRVVQYLEGQAKPHFTNELTQRSTPTEGDFFDDGKGDDLYEEAVKIVVHNRRGSVSLLQRKLEIGYSRAARLIDMMAEDGVVGPHKGSNPRDVVMTPEAWEQWRASRHEKSA